MEFKNKQDDYQDFVNKIKDCKLCRLCEKRTQVVPGYGNLDADLMFVGEGPGEQEDELGIPFVGRAGQLLDKIFKAADLSREKDMYITNIVKCRPPENRDPEKDEIEECKSYLYYQIELIKPKVIVPLGNYSMRFFLDTTLGITKTRGTINDWNGIKIIPMYHPSYVLRNQSKKVKGETWQDILLVKKMIMNK